MPTKIEWVQNSDGTKGETWNVTTGCSPISEGCKNCYAERMAKRQVAMGFARYERGSENDDTWIAYSNAINPDTGRWSGEITCCYVKLDEPLRWRKPRRVFVNSMSDLFYEGVPDEFVELVWLHMLFAKWHTFLILTKRPGRMLKFMDWYGGRQCVNPRDSDLPYPNIWLGVSAENQQRADERIPLLLQTPAAKRFVSLEPLLAGIDLTPYLHCGLSWCIIGCESGPNARPMKDEWARRIISQCNTYQIPVFYKQQMTEGKLVKLPLMDGKQYVEFPQTIDRLNES